MRSRNGPYSAFTRNLDSNNIDGLVTGEFNTMGVLTPGIRTKRGLAKYNNNHLELKTLSVLQMAKNYSNEQSLNDILRKHFTKGFNATDLEILNTISWPYFPRWSPEEMELGRHWQVNKPHALVFHLPHNHAAGVEAAGPAEDVVCRLLSLLRVRSGGHGVQQSPPQPDVGLINESVIK